MAYKTAQVTKAGSQGKVRKVNPSLKAHEVQEYMGGNRWDCIHVGNRRVCNLYWVEMVKANPDKVYRVVVSDWQP